MKESKINAEGEKKRIVNSKNNCKRREKARNNQLIARRKSNGRLEKAGKLQN